MASSDKARVRLHGRFPAGTKVELHDRTSDTFNPGQLGKAVKKAKTNKHSEVVFEDVPSGQSYWVTDGERGVAVTSKGPRASKPETKPLASAAPGRDTKRNVVVGARSTKDRPDAPHPAFASKVPGRPTPRGDREAEPQPHTRLEDAPSGTKLRSHTVSGEAHPTDPDELQPKPAQEHVGSSAVQRSSTEAGEATPKDPKEQVPYAKQEDVPSGTKQRSATPVGQAEPKPKAKGAQSERGKETAPAKARGRSPEKTEEQVKPKATVKKTTKAGTPRRKKSSKSKSTSKRS